MKKNIFYYLGLFLLCLYTWEIISNIITFNQVFKSFLYIFISLCFLINLFSQKYFKKEIWIIIFLLILCFYTSMVTGVYSIFLGYLAVLSSKNISNKKIVKLILFSDILFLFIHIFITLVFNINSGELYYTSSGLFRYSFNLRHPNSLAGTSFWSLAAYLYLSDKSKSFKMIITILIMLIVYKLTYSRTTLILYILLCIFLMLNAEKYNQKTLKISKIILIILIILSVLFSYKYFNISGNVKTILYTLNSLLSNRLILNSIGVNYYKYTLFGQYINYYNIISYHGYRLSRLVLDSFYISCLINYGIIHIFILIYAFSKYTRKVVDYKSWVLILLLLISGLTEKYIIYVTLGFPLFFLKDVIFSNKIIKEENDE